MFLGHWHMLREIIRSSFNNLPTMNSLSSQYLQQGARTQIRCRALIHTIDYALLGLVQWEVRLQIELSRYLDMKLGHRSKCQKLHIYSLSPTRGRNWAYFRSMGSGFQDMDWFLALLDSVSRGHGMGFLSIVRRLPSVRPSVVRPFVSQLSLNLMHGFLSNFSSSFPWAIRSDVFWFFFF